MAAFVAPRYAQKNARVGGTRRRPGEEEEENISKYFCTSDGDKPEDWGEGRWEEEEEEELDPLRFHGNAIAVSRSPKRVAGGVVTDNG